MFSSPERVQQALASVGYITHEITATVVYLAAMLNKPILKEGPPWERQDPTGLFGCLGNRSRTTRFGGLDSVVTRNEETAQTEPISVDSAEQLQEQKTGLGSQS